MQVSGGRPPTEAELYYVTNRRHRGDNRWAPDSYGDEPSSYGTENLRFGKVVLPYDPDEVQAYLGQDCGFGKGDGCTLSEYLVGRTDSAQINREPVRHGWPNVWRMRREADKGSAM